MGARSCLGARRGNGPARPGRRPALTPAIRSGDNRTRLEGQDAYDPPPSPPQNPSENRLEFSTKVVAPEKTVAPCIAVGVFESRKLTGAAEALDRATRGALRERLKHGD